MGRAREEFEDNMSRLDRAFVDKPRTIEDMLMNKDIEAEIGILQAKLPLEEEIEKYAELIRKNNKVDMSGDVVRAIIKGSISVNKESK